MNGPFIDQPLSAAQIRVLGSLIEKEITVPDSYPLSLNALINACNQSSNRDPVVQYDEKIVADAVRGLRERALVRAAQASDARVPKFQHLITEKLELGAREVAVLCVLMLRGPQTLGEIRTRGARLFEFASLEDVDATLTALAERASGALVTRLPRRRGQKDARYAQLLGGAVAVDEESSSQDPDGVEHVVAPAAHDSGATRLTALEETVAELRKEIGDLRAEVDQFRRMFE